MADDAPKPSEVAHDPAPSGNQQKIDPWSVSGEVGEDGKVKAIDYAKLTNEFGTQMIDDALLERFERVTGHKPHRFMRRQIVFSHRDLTTILDRYEKNEPFFLYTGRGPSSDSMHVGHTQVFDFVKWLQDVLDAPLIIMLTDDEKFLFSEKRTVEEVMGYTRTNAKDIIAIGFDPKKTFIFSDFEYVGGAFYRNIVRFSKRVTYNKAKAIFGFDDRYVTRTVFQSETYNADSSLAQTLARFTSPASRVPQPLQRPSPTSLAVTRSELPKFPVSFLAPLTKILTSD